MDILIITICVLSYVQVSTCNAVYIPDHFYEIDPNTIKKFNGTGNYADLDLQSHIPLLGNTMCVNSCRDPVPLWVGKNGVMEYKRYPIIWYDQTTLTEEPYRMGRVDTSKTAIIAPLWTWLSTADGTGTIYYQQTSKRTILQQAQADVRNNFHCGRRFSPTSALIVTWYNMPIDTCISEAQQNNVGVDKYCACRGSHDVDYCLCNSHSIEKYCSCRSRRDDYEKCKCHEHFLDVYGVDLSGYCHCLIDHNEVRDTCDCYRWKLWEDLAYCRYQTTGVMDYDYCEWKYNWVFCECAFDSKYVDRLGEAAAWDLCWCIYWEHYMYNCCPSTIEPDLCSCLTTYEAHLERYMNHVEILDFCECMIIGSGDEVGCGCSDCPLDAGKRELLPEETMVQQVHASTEEKKRMKREDRSRRSDFSVYDYSVEPWSKNYNTFQVVMVTDGTQTYAIYNYESLNVPRYLGNRKRPAVVGFDGYGSSDGFEHKYSYKKALYKLKKKSNVGIKGRWMYRVDGTSVVEPADC